MNNLTQPHRKKDLKTQEAPKDFNPPVPNYLIKSLYSVMLTEWSLETVRDFWGEHPLVLDTGEILREESLYRKLWEENGSLPLQFVWRALDCLERFCVPRNYRASEVVDKLGVRINGAAFVPGRMLLAWIKPFLPMFLRALDPRDVFWRALGATAERYVPGTVHRCVQLRRQEDWLHAWILYISDKTFSGGYATDYDLLSARVLQKHPLVFGAQPFDSTAPLSDCRAVEKVLWDGNFEFRDDQLFIKDRMYGRKVGFYDHCGGLLKSLKKFKVPDREVVLVEEDYFCPLRKRVVLYRGCVYGAPVVLQFFKHQKIKGNPRKHLDALMDDLLKEEKIHWVHAERMHHRLLQSAEFKAEFRYNQKEQVIFLNGERLISNLPAQILKVILSQFVHDGKTLFYYAEFNEDPELKRVLVNTNIRVRIPRLCASLNKVSPKLQLEKKGRGTILLKVECPVELIVE